MTDTDYRIRVQPFGVKEKKWVAYPEYNLGASSLHPWMTFWSATSVSPVRFVRRNKEKAVARAQKHLEQVKAAAIEDAAAEAAKERRAARAEIREVK